MNEEDRYGTESWGAGSGRRRYDSATFRGLIGGFTTYEPEVKPHVHACKDREHVWMHVDPLCDLPRDPGFAAALPCPDHDGGPRNQTSRGGLPKGIAGVVVLLALLLSGCTADWRTEPPPLPTRANDCPLGMKYIILNVENKDDRYNFTVRGCIG